MDTVALGTAAAVAVLLVPLVSLIKKDSWSSQAKYALGLAASLVAAMVGGLIDGDINSLKEGFSYIGTAFLSAQTIYSLFFKGSSIDNTLTETNVL